MTADFGAVGGVRGRSRHGPGWATAETATVTVGADGRASRIARAVRAAEYDVAPSATRWYFSYWSGVQDAGLLAEAIDEGLSGRQPMEEAMAAYERLRNEASMPDSRENVQRARFEPMPPEQRQLRAALSLDQDATNRFYLAFEGMMPPEAFFNRENLGRIMARAADAPPPPEAPA